jgi:hypothetical protein
MQAKSSIIFRSVIVLAAVVFLASCGTSGGGGITTTVPTYITASWTGGAHGDPTDRTDVEATEFSGQMCPASAIDLQNWINNSNVLTMINNCSISVTLAMCVAKGSLPQPDIGGLNQCATDPFDTPAADLKYNTILGGPGAEDYRNTTENLSLVVFFCSDDQTICAPPICEQVSCL